MFFKKKDTIRIKADVNNPEEKFVQVPIYQTFDKLKILSLELGQEDAYRLFDADYGVVAGRVIGNEGVGIPNTKVSIFIPISQEDQELLEKDRRKLTLDEVNRLRALAIYPFTTPDDTDSDGRRYNLLPSLSRNRGFNGFIANNFGIGATPKQPFGSQPEKEQILVNDSLLYIHDRYLEFQTVTNQSGDFLLFGVPVGEQTLHIDCDITDIGPFSITPPLMQRILGLPSNAFTENGTKIKESNDLSTLPHIETQNIGIRVKPLWSQINEQVNIGITRQDIRLKTRIVPSTTIFASGITPKGNSWWGDRVIFRFKFGLRNLCISIGSCNYNDLIPNQCVWDFALKFILCFKIAFKIKIRIDTKILKWEITLIDQLINIIDVNGNCGNPTTSGNFTFKVRFKIGLCIGINIPNIIPFFGFEFRDFYCRLKGGKYDSNPFDIINYGKTCACTRESALETIPEDGISDILDVDQFNSADMNVKVFEINNQTISDEDIKILDEWSRAENDNSSNINFNNFNPVNDFDINNDVINLNQESQFSLIKDSGYFILQIPCNRKRVITNERGDLILSDDPNKGVFIEWRGYLYVQSNNNVENPRTIDRVGKGRLKIPQDRNYNNNPKKWIARHGTFKAGNIYSVTQFIATRNAQFDSNQEKEQLQEPLLVRAISSGIPLSSNIFGQTQELISLANDLNNRELLGRPDEKGWDFQSGLILTNASSNFPFNHITTLGREINENELNKLREKLLDLEDRQNIDLGLDANELTTIGNVSDIDSQEVGNSNSNEPITSDFEFLGIFPNQTSGSITIRSTSTSSQDIVIVFKKQFWNSLENAEQQIIVKGYNTNLINDNNDIFSMIFRYTIGFYQGLPTPPLNTTNYTNGNKIFAGGGLDNPQTIENIQNTNVEYEAFKFGSSFLPFLKAVYVPPITTGLYTGVNKNIGQISLSRGYIDNSSWRSIGYTPGNEPKPPYYTLKININEFYKTNRTAGAPGGTVLKTLLIEDLSQRDNNLIIDLNGYFISKGSGVSLKTIPNLNF